jgi:ABC-type polar amino acid transport system ATPase subunit
LKELKSFKQAILASALCKTYEAFSGRLTVLDGVDFEVGEGELMVLSGPSGSGKTTLLNVIARALGSRRDLRIQPVCVYQAFEKVDVGTHPRVLKRSIFF